MYVHKIRKCGSGPPMQPAEPHVALGPRVGYLCSNTFHWSSFLKY